MQILLNNLLDPVKTAQSRCHVIVDTVAPVLTRFPVAKMNFKCHSRSPEMMRSRGVTGHIYVRLQTFHSNFGSIWHPFQSTTNWPKITSYLYLTPRLRVTSPTITTPFSREKAIMRGL